MKIEGSVIHGSRYTILPDSRGITEHKETWYLSVDGDTDKYVMAFRLHITQDCIGAFKCMLVLQKKAFPAAVTCIESVRGYGTCETGATSSHFFKFGSDDFRLEEQDRMVFSGTYLGCGFLQCKFTFYFKEVTFAGGECTMVLAPKLQKMTGLPEKPKATNLLDTRSGTKSRRDNWSSNWAGPKISCAICFEDKPQMVCLPCGHVCICEGCSKELVRLRKTLCPICRKAFVDGQQLNVFFS